MISISVRLMFTWITFQKYKRLGTYEFVRTKEWNLFRDSDVFVNVLCWRMNADEKTNENKPASQYVMEYAQWRVGVNSSQ